MTELVVQIEDASLVADLKRLGFRCLLMKFVLVNYTRQKMLMIL